MQYRKIIININKNFSLYLYVNSIYMNIRESIRREINKLYIKEGASNLPPGAEHWTDAPWNDGENVKSGTEPKEYKLEILFFDESNAIAIFKDKLSGIKYLFNTDIESLDDYAEYADREETYLGRDEDGDPDIEYGDWEIDENVVDRYVNDNISYFKVGNGYIDWENGGYDLYILDNELMSEFKLENNKEMNESIRKIVREVLSESFEDYDMPLLKKIMLKLKGVSEEKLKYNIENDLPWDWKGSKEGFYEKMEPRNNYTGSN